MKITYICAECGTYGLTEKKCSSCGNKHQVDFFQEDAKMRTSNKYDGIKVEAISRFKLVLKMYFKEYPNLNHKNKDEIDILSRRLFNILMGKTSFYLYTSNEDKYNIGNVNLL